MKKYMRGVCAFLLLSLVVLGLSGCTNYTDEEIKNLKDSEFNAGIASIDQEVIKQTAVDDYVALLPVEEVTEEVAAEEVVNLLTAYSEDYFLGDDVKVDLGDNKVEALLDTEIEFNDEDYDVSEHLIFSADARFVASQENQYKEFENTPYLVLESKGALIYEFRFDDVIDIKDIDNDEPLEINFLGKLLKIVDVDTNEMTITTGKELWMTPNDIDIFDGKTLTLINVGVNSVVVSVDTVIETIRVGNTERVNGLEITVNEVFYEDDKTQRMAEILAGSDARRDIDNGDAMEAYDQDENDPEWVWDIVVNGDDLESIRAVYDQKRDDLDDDFVPLAIGEKLEFPNNFLNVVFKEMSSPEYVRYEVKDDGSDRYEIDSNNEEGFICGTDEYDRVYLDVIAGKFYDDDDYDVSSKIACLNLDLGDSEFLLSKSLKLYYESDANLYFDFLGIDDGDVYDRDELIMDNYGVIFEDMEDWVDNKEEVSFEVPDEQLEVTIGVY